MKSTDETVTLKHRCLGRKMPGLDLALSPQNLYKLEVGSKVQCGKPVEYGVIKWIGVLPERGNFLYAGLEMMSYVCINYCVTICTYFCNDNLNQNIPGVNAAP